MSAMAIAWIVFGCVFGAAMLGLFIGEALPEHHLSQESKDVVKLGTALIATIAALVLSLLISSAKSSFDRMNDEIVQNAAEAVLLDRVLADYGPETRALRDTMKRSYATTIELLSSGDKSQQAKLDTPEAVARMENFQAKLRELSPQNDAQRWLQSQALQIGSDLMETRWLVLGGLGSSVPLPFLVVVVFWLMIIFGSFGLFAPRNVTVVAVLFLCALSVAGSIFLILSMDQPFEGLMKISSAPLRYTLSHLGQ